MIVALVGVSVVVVLRSATKQTASLDFNSKLTPTAVQRLEYIEQHTDKVNTHAPQVRLVVNGLDLGERHIARFSYSIESGRLHRASWTEGKYTYEEVRATLFDFLNDAKTNGAEDIDTAIARVQDMEDIRSQYHTTYRDVSFAVQLAGCRFFVRTVYSYDHDKPFILYFEVSD